jgi:hypothetical protein
MRTLAICYLLLSLALLPQAALGQGKKGKGANLQPTTAADYDALSGMTQVFGKVVSIDPNTGVILIRAEYQVPDPNAKPKQPNIKVQPLPRPKVNNNNNNNRNNRIGNNKNKNNKNRVQPNQQAIRAMQQYQQRMMQLQQQQMQQFQKMMQQMAKNQQGANVKLVTMAKEFELYLVKDVPVARVTVPGEYDAKGNFKEPTPEELKKLKHPKLPGYTCPLEEVLPGQSVNLYLGKADPKQKAVQGDLLKNNPLGGQGGPPANAPAVTGILIVTDVDLSSLPKQPRKKK